MCMICGLRYCPVTCPSYEAEEDPWVTGTCEECGAVLYAEGQRWCERCEDAKEKEDDNGSE